MISSVFVFVPNLSLRLQVTPQHPFDQSQPHIHHQQPSFAPHYSLPPPPYSSREDEVRTLFIAGLPDDTKTREIYNLFREFPGFQNCQLKRSGPSSQMATQEKTDTRAKWNENHRTHLVKLLGDYNIPAYRSQNGWTKEAWNRILCDMVTKFPNLKCTIVQVKALEQELKKIYKLLKGFTELSGFGWDNEKNMVEATEEVWAPLLERNKEARRWHQKPFPYFTALQEIYEGRYAEGRRSRDVDYYSNVPMTTPYPSIPAPNDPIESLSTPEIETEDHDFAQTEPPCSQPYISQPQTSCSARRQSVGDERRKKDRKRKNIQEAFLEKYMDMRRAENDRYIDAMKTNKVEEKYTIGECMAAFNMVCDQLSDDEFVKATTLFKDKDNREIFLNLNEDRKVLWLRQMIN